MPEIFKYKVPAIFQIAGTFGIKTPEPNVYLSFDDGPSPEVTPFVLKTLAQANAQATFFCSGKQAEQYPGLFAEIKKQNHQIGNHGYNHLNGLKTNTKTYLSDIAKGNKIIQSSLFRPPYGKMKPTQFFKLKKQFKIIFWTLMTRDFDSKTKWQEDFEKIKPIIKKGTIILLHDTPKTKQKLVNILPAILEYGKEKGLKFTKIE